ncbi:hypothetical protein TcWFU_000575 [Taenia crassiceps]|uniref:Uncharacterized protein n=1 Tax=Taenia crassiceps TaxID=6207 RepID=A0ABR4QJF7_9CEST
MVSRTMPVGYWNFGNEKKSYALIRALRTHNLTISGGGVTLQIKSNVCSDTQHAVCLTIYVQWSDGSDQQDQKTPSRLLARSSDVQTIH